MPALDLSLARRDLSAALSRRGLGDSDTLVNLLIVVLGLVFFALILVAILFLIRRMRRAKQMQADTLPAYQKDWNRSRSNVGGAAPSSPLYRDFQPHHHQEPQHYRDQRERDRDNQFQTSSRNHRRLTITTADGRQSAVLVFGENGNPMLTNPASPPHSPDNVPAIHITFPDEQDEQGHRKSGRVVVVRVGESTVGLEPYRGPAAARDEQLPAYEKEVKGDGFQSLDLDKIGGLKEKERINWR